MNLHCAIEMGNIDDCRFLINDNNVNNKNLDGKTPLIIAASNGYFGICLLLLKYKVRVNMGDSKGNKALNYACSNGYKDI